MAKQRTISLVLYYSNEYGDHDFMNATFATLIFIKNGVIQPEFNTHAVFKKKKTIASGATKQVAGWELKIKVDIDQLVKYCFNSTHKEKYLKILGLNKNITATNTSVFNPEKGKIKALMEKLLR